MTYDEFRKLAQNGDLLFLEVDQNDILSKIGGTIVSWATGSTFSHVAMVFWYKDRLMLVESAPSSGVRLVNASIYDGRSITRVAAPKSWDSVEASALQKLGVVKYGWTSAIWIGFRDIMFIHFGIKLNQDTTNRNLVCSEFVAEILGLDETDIPPSMLYQILTNPTNPTNI